jgi:predicted transcriptional regulator of viral defense system
MKWETLLSIVGSEAVFSTSLLLTGSESRVNIQLQLSRWVKGGKLHQLRRGLYVLAEPYRKVEPHPFLMANRVKVPSYVSLQSALAYYGLIPEYVPVVTSVTTNRPGIITTSEGTFSYRHIKKSMFRGYAGVDAAKQQTVFLALPEKSLLDLIYLTPGGESAEYLEELRLQHTENLDKEKLMEFAEENGSPKLHIAVERILRVIRDEGENS